MVISLAENCIYTDTELLSSQIAKDICNLTNSKNLYNGQRYEFSEVKRILEGYGFKYMGADEINESHDFVSDLYEVNIYPIDFYPHLAKFRFFNLT